MVDRAIAILEAIAGGPITNELMLRVANAFLPDGVDPLVATNEEKATYFLREVRRMVKLRVLESEERIAYEAAMLAARADVETNVDLGSD